MVVKFLHLSAAYEILHLQLEVLYYTVFFVIVLRSILTSHNVYFTDALQSTTYSTRITLPDEMHTLDLLILYYLNKYCVCGMLMIQ